MHTRIKPCGSSSQCPCTGRGQGRGAAGVTLALVLPPLSPSPVPHLPCSALSVVHETETLFFPSPPSLAAVGCAVGPWGPWSGCSSPCGVGSRARSRQVTVPPRHGGDPCPDLKQRRGCLGQHPTCGTAKGNVGCLLPSCVVVPMCCRPRCPSWGVFNHPRAPHSCSSARGSQDTAQLLQPGLESCLAKSWAAAAGGALWLPPPQLLRLFPPDAGGAPVPWASLEPPAAPGQAGVCGMLGESVPAPSPLHWTRAARSQDILGGCFCGRVPGLVGAGGPAGGLCLLPTSSHLCVGSPWEGSYGRQDT
ncbi:PREDICTED: SCO-spondin isoform X2 [Corvus brachyrhynchos]|uniref:SCO-spondin isoform X2 n=1 Tax=Corvus brachyrhynchos TaxID=85066 RepID=UPI000816435F|nr:PREDICTED: SCO-spondin isoform X2 [Corvus brachyrhynchos]